MTAREILDICTKNGVGVTGKLEDMGVTGYASDGCQELAESCLKRMEEYVRYGVNYGFSGVKEALEDLGSLIVKLSDKKAEKKLAKYEDEKRKIEAEVKLPKQGEPMEIKEEVFKYIETCLAACEVIEGMNMAEDRVKVLKKSRSKFQELKTKIENAIDGSSKDAAEKAGQIIHEIRRWRNDAAILMHSETSLSYLDNALKIADEWGQLSLSVRTGGLFSRDRTAKEKDIVRYEKDAIDRIAASIHVRDKIEIFGENLKAYRKSVGERYDTTELLEKQKEYREQIEALERERAEIFQKQRNGEMDKVDALRRCRDEIDPDLEDLRADVKRLSSEISEKNAMQRDYSRVYRKLTAINDFIMSYRNDPAMLFTLGVAMDFNKLNNVMRGLSSPDEINHVIDLELANRYVDNRVREQFTALRVSLEEAEKEMNDSMLGKKLGVSPEKARAEEERLRRKEEEDADRYFANLAPEPEEKPEEETTRVRYSPLSDDDK